MGIELIILDIDFTVIFPIKNIIEKSTQKCCLFFHKQTITEKIAIDYKCHRSSTGKTAQNLLTNYGYHNQDQWCIDENVKYGHLDEQNSSIPKGMKPYTHETYQEEKSKVKNQLLKTSVCYGERYKHYGCSKGYLASPQKLFKVFDQSIEQNIPIIILTCGLYHPNFVKKLLTFFPEKYNVSSKKHYQVKNKYSDDDKKKSDQKFYYFQFNKKNDSSKNGYIFFFNQQDLKSNFFQHKHKKLAKKNKQLEPDINPNFGFDFRKGITGMVCASMIPCNILNENKLLSKIRNNSSYLNRNDYKNVLLIDDNYHDVIKSAKKLGITTVQALLTKNLKPCHYAEAIKILTLLEEPAPNINYSCTR